MSEKIAGYILLATGILLILFSMFSIYGVFTGQAKPPRVFQFEGISLDLTSQIIPNSKPTQVIPAALINETSNLFVYLLLMGFVASTGQKLASLGIQLLRPIVVKLNEQKQ